MKIKIMNEGWGAYLHYRILNALDLPHDLHMEFLVRHNQVIRPAPGSLSPYHLGFTIAQQPINHLHSFWQWKVALESRLEDKPVFLVNDGKDSVKATYQLLL